jgi:hypothetical protein
MKYGLILILVKNNNIFDSLVCHWNHETGEPKTIGKINNYVVQFLNVPINKFTLCRIFDTITKKPVAITRLNYFGKGENVFETYMLGVSAKYRG